MRPQPGDLIHGKYRLVRILGDGGMGTIFEARHEVLGTSVAIKFLHPELARRSGLIARFLQEARVSATIHSLHVVQVIDVEQDPSGAFLVMELLRGETLQSVLDHRRTLEVPAAIDCALQMLAGLDAAHEAGVVHRDLKPENVFLVMTAQGPLVKLLDFGIAKLRSAPEFQRGLTRPGVVMGTPEYMAPEQAFSADTVDARADLYAIGVMLFEMLSGERPVAGDDARTIAQAVLSGHIQPLSALCPSLPAELIAVVHKAMAPNSNHRFSSASEMQRELLPFAPMLSHAARHAVGSLTQAQSAWAPSQVAESPEPRRSYVPKTLPPEAPEHPAEQLVTPIRDAPTTQEPHPPHGLGSPPAASTVVVHTPWHEASRGAVGPSPRTERNPLPHPLGYGSTNPMSQLGAYGYGYGPPPQAMAPPPAARAYVPLAAPLAQQRRPPLGLIAVLATVAGGLLVLLVLVLTHPSSSNSEPSPALSVTPAPIALQAASADASVTLPMPVTTATASPAHATVTGIPPVTPPIRPPGHATTKDAGSEAGAADADASTPFGLPPFPNLLDAGFPLPSAFPTGLPFPGFPGAPTKPSPP